ncbi:MAG: MFS transporter [Candidatus Omnitrophica bacterium]|nr:MFS transporter [Candidatus Omnitrophota bacterium]
MIRLPAVVNDLPPSTRRNLDISWREGIPANVMLAVMDYYLIPFALFLGASPFEVGLLVAVPHLLGSLSQMVASRVVRMAGSRLKFLVIGATIQGLCLVPMGMLAFRAFEGRLGVLILFAVVFRVSANLTGTAWGSLMSEYLPEEKRGRFIGWRSRIVGAAGVAGMVTAGLLLYAAKQVSLAWGFAILFGFIAACRIWSASFFRRMDDLPMEFRPEHQFTFVEFIRRFRQSNFVKFTLFVASITFATQMAAPHFVGHMLNNLQFSYLQFMTAEIMVVVAGLISFPLWGNLADRVGNARVLKTASLLIPAIPVLWLLSGNFYYLVAVEFVSGFIWAGFNLASANFVYDAVMPAKRVRCLGYYNFMIGIAVFLGAVSGGFLAEHLPAIWGHRILTLFALSAGLRLASNLFLSGKFREVRVRTQAVSSTDLFFRVLGIRPVAGRQSEPATLWLPKAVSPAGVRSQGEGGNVEASA